MEGQKVCFTAVSCHENIVSKSHHSDSSSEVVDRKAYFIEKYPTYVQETNKTYSDPRRPLDLQFDIDCWVDSEGDWSCGIDSVGNMSSSGFGLERIIREMQTLYPCKIEEMAELLSLFYDVTDPHLVVKEIKLLGPDDKLNGVYFPSDNKYLYDTLGLRASYVSHVLRRAVSNT